MKIVYVIQPIGPTNAYAMDYGTKRNSMLLVVELSCHSYSP